MQNQTTEPKERQKRKLSSIDGLEGRVSELGGRYGFGLANHGQANRQRDNAERSAGLYGSRLEGRATTMRSCRAFEGKMGRSAPHWTPTKGKAHASLRANSVGPGVHIVCAISENVAKETCVASLDAGSPISLRVTSQGNGQAYSETLSYLNFLQPDEILLNEGRRNSYLACKILSSYTEGGEITKVSDGNSTKSKSLALGGNEEVVDNNRPCQTATVIKFVPRAYFDQTRGADLLRQIAREHSYDTSVLEDYILLSSSHAVLHYTQICLGASFSRRCLELIVSSGGSNRMMIDRSSIVNLELLANAKTGKFKHSLIGTIDHTKTTVGSRLLRSNLISPLTCVSTINRRLDLVQTIQQDEKFFFNLMGRLESLPDADWMLTNLALKPWKRIKQKGSSLSARVASKGISALVFMKTFLSAIPPFATMLEDQLRQIQSRRKASNDSNLSDYDHLLRAIITSLKNPSLVVVLNAVQEIFTDSTSFTRNAHAMKHQECFALKPKPNGMMSLIREAFLSNTNDIYRLADQYANRFDCRVIVKYSSARGYFLALPIEMSTNLPDKFIQPVKSTRYVNCTTEEVRSLNTRAQENVRDLLVMTHERIQEVLDVAREHFDVLAAISDSVALLDMCHCFAEVVATSRQPWCRPMVSDVPELLIQAGRNVIHPAVVGVSPGDGEMIPHERPFVPNDTYTPVSKPFTVISGINGSGKSTYIKQVAIITVLAHIGCYVPAEKALIPVRDRIATRIGIGDAQEHNISTFMMEMKDASFLCSSITARTLVLVDELGRATSNEDGIAIAWAVSEWLVASGAITFFVSHYPQLARLSEAYSRVQNQHMGATVLGLGGGIRYSHKISPGSCQVSSDYGVEMSAACGWPNDVIKLANVVRAQAKGKVSSGIPLQLGHPAEPGHSSKIITDLTIRLRPHCVKESSSLEILRQELQKMKESGLLGDRTVPPVNPALGRDSKASGNEDSTETSSGGGESSEQSLVTSTRSSLSS